MNRYTAIKAAMKKRIKTPTIDVDDKSNSGKKIASLISASKSKK